MATVKKSTKTKKTREKKQHQPDYYPVQRTIPLGVDGSNLTGTCVGDAGKLLSISNRRLYRYGKMYQMKLDLHVDVTNNTNIEVEVYALRNTWDVQRGFALAKKVWDESTAEERENAGSAIARWRDFRVQHGIASANVLDPVRYDNSTLAANVDNNGEHLDSVVDKAGTQTFFTWGYASATALSVPAEWNAAGRTSNEPASFSTTSPYDGVNSDEMSDVEIAALADRGNSPPYASQSATDIYVKVGTLFIRPGAAPTNSGGLTKLSTGYFDAPCGLFALKFNTALSNGQMDLVVKSGDYKGVHALSMSQ